MSDPIGEVNVPMPRIIEEPLEKLQSFYKKEEKYAKQLFLMGLLLILGYKAGF